MTLDIRSIAALAHPLLLRRGAAARRRLARVEGRPVPRARAGAVDATVQSTPPRSWPRTLVDAALGHRLCVPPQSLSHSSNVHADPIAPQLSFHPASRARDWASVGKSEHQTWAELAWAAVFPQRSGAGRTDAASELRVHRR